MSNLFGSLWQDESGFVVSAELALVSTLGVLGLTAGLSQAAGSVNGELHDFGVAIRSMKQPYQQPATNLAFDYVPTDSFSR